MVTKDLRELLNTKDKKILAELSKIDTSHQEATTQLKANKTFLKALLKPIKSYMVLKPRSAAHSKLNAVGEKIEKRLEL